MLLGLFLVRFSLIFLFVPCGGLSWLHVSFLLHVKYTLLYRVVSYCTRSSAVAERPRDTSCPSVVNFNSTIPRTQVFFGFRFTNAYNQIRLCCLRRNVDASCHNRFVFRLWRSTNAPLTATSDECHQLATVRHHSVYNT